MANLKRLTRAERVLIEAFIKTNAKTIRATAKSRGYILTDAAGIADVVTTLRVGTVMGIDVRRSQALADGHIDYYGSDGVLIVSS